MRQCRMCSQRLTRPGRLCRECERELDRARHAGVAIGELAPVLSSLDASRIAGAGLRWPRPPGALIAAAFAIGVTGAIALHAVESSSHATMATDSVMFDTRPATRSHRVTPDVTRTATHDAEPGAERTAAASVPREAPATAGTPAPRVTNAPRGAEPGTAALAAATKAGSAVQQVATVAHVPSAESRASSDPPSSLEDALSRCGEERFLARPACEERARTRHCVAGAEQSPQCVVSTRDYGQ
jgi:hypothetical protein